MPRITLKKKCMVKIYMLKVKRIERTKVNLEVLWISLVEIAPKACYSLLITLCGKLWPLVHIILSQLYKAITIFFVNGFHDNYAISDPNSLIIISTKMNQKFGVRPAHRCGLLAGKYSFLCPWARLQVQQQYANNSWLPSCSSALTWIIKAAARE